MNALPSWRAIKLASVPCRHPKARAAVLIATAWTSVAALLTLRGWLTGLHAGDAHAWSILRLQLSHRLHLGGDDARYRYQGAFRALCKPILAGLRRSRGCAEGLWATGQWRGQLPSFEPDQARIAEAGAAQPGCPEIRASQSLIAGQRSRLSPGVSRRRR